MRVTRLVRRLGLSLAWWWGLTSAVFLLSYRDQAAAAAEFLPDATQLRGAAGTLQQQQQLAQALQARLGFDAPLFYFSRQTTPGGRPRWRWHGTRNQYHWWLRNLVRGKLGYSLRSGQPVRAQLAEAVGYTLPLTGAALVVAVGLAVALGQRLVQWRRRWQAFAHGALVGLHSLPLFVVALGLLLLFANPEGLQWFPIGGPASAPAVPTLAELAERVAHLVLPVATLVLVALPELTLALEASLQRELRAGYAVTARAKGLSEAQVIRRHALRNALPPLLTLGAELVPALVAGAVVVEVVFALPGMGRLMAGAAVQRDYPLGGLLLTGGARVVALLLADVGYRWADPRIN
jgi:peptide/nickel transport system permease protein